MPDFAQLKMAVEDALKAYPLFQLEGEKPVTEAATVAPEDGLIPQPLSSAMRYSLLLPGKRLRPVLLLSAYALLKPDWDKALPFACALEMIHTYSLIHDDLPALDNDDLRRGRPTNHRVYGENMAILAGDGLLNLAYETMLEAEISRERPANALAAMGEIARRAGVRGMIAGQTLDVKLENALPNESLVRYIHRHKTADLFAAPVLGGLLLADASLAQLAAGKTYAENLGLAFQIVDDLLDIGGDAQVMGKQTGMDAQRGKMTWPTVFGEKRAREDAESAAQKAAEAVSLFGAAGSFLRELAANTLVRAR